MQFQLKRSGNGRGRVTGTKLDCGTICTAQYDYGKPLALTVAGRTGRSSTAGTASARRRRRPARSPSARSPRSRRSSSAMGSRRARRRAQRRRGDTKRPLHPLDRVHRQRRRSTGYRVYLERCRRGRHARNRAGLHGLVCGHSYAIAVDAVDRNRQSLAESDDHAEDEAVQACGANRRGGGEADGQGPHVLVQLRVNRSTSARLKLRASDRRVGSGRFPCRSWHEHAAAEGARTWAGGRPCRLNVVLVNPDGGSLALPGRGIVQVPRAR